MLSEPALQTPIRPPGRHPALKPWWRGALASDRVKDRPPAGRVAAARRAVLDSVRRQSKLASKVSRRGLAAAGGVWRDAGSNPLPAEEGGARAVRRGRERDYALTNFTLTPLPARRPMSYPPHPPTAARRAPPFPHGRGFKRVDAQRIENKVQRFQRPELSRPEFIPTLQTARMLVPPRRMERAHGQRPMRRRGAIEREALSAMSSACVGTASNLASLVPVGPGTQIRRDVRAGFAAGGRTTLAIRDQARWPDPPAAGSKARLQQGLASRARG